MSGHSVAAQQQQKAPLSFTPLHTGVLQRQCACGGTPGVDGICEECRNKRLSSQRQVTLATLQTKLTVNKPGDRYELEADQVAEQVMGTPEPEHMSVVPSLTQGIHIQHLYSDHRELHRQPENEDKDEDLQRQSMEEEEDGENLQAKEASGQTPNVTSALQTRISSIRGSGQLLPQPIRSFMEPRFGHDFSQVRIHTDTQAAETAQAVRARAFTLGRDIVFGIGQYTPSTAEGKMLLAHELTHVVQQNSLTSNNAFIQKKDNKRKHTKSAPQTATKEEVDASQLDISLLIDEIAAAVEPYMNKIKDDKGFNEGWEPIKKRIGSPKLLSSPSVTDKANFPDLYKPDLVNKLLILHKLNSKQNALSKKKKSQNKLLNQVLNGVVEKLAQSRTKITGIDYKKEYDELLSIPSIPGNISGGLSDYISGLRTALMEKFCTFDRIKQYYRDEVVRMQFLSQSVWVHKDMRDKLQATEILLKGAQESSAIASIKDIGGLEIRANANKKKSNSGKINLSKHSYGWAIDIRPYTNPNVPNFPEALVKEFTGVGFSLAPDVKDTRNKDIRDVRAAIESKGKTKVSLEAIQRLIQASKTFVEMSKEAFKDEVSLRNKLIEYLQKQGNETANEKTKALIDLYKKVYADDQEYKKATKKEKKELENKLKDSYNSLRSWIAIQTKTLHNPKESAELLLEVYDVYAGTRDEKGGFKEAAAQIIGTPATLASQGFIDLPPELIKALIDSGLIWLGTSKGTKDFMHFELHRDPTSSNLCQPAKVEDPDSDS